MTSSSSPALQSACLEIGGFFVNETTTSPPAQVALPAHRKIRFKQYLALIDQEASGQAAHASLASPSSPPPRTVKQYSSSSSSPK
jgi:hypothetical protein